MYNEQQLDQLDADTTSVTKPRRCQINADHATTFGTSATHPNTHSLLRNGPRHCSACAGGSSAELKSTWANRAHVPRFEVLLLLAVVSHHKQVMTNLQHKQLLMLV
jgi:hypothetical protein